MLGNKINVIEWDINTVTLSDYSVEMPINREGYRHWFNHVFHGPGGDYTKNISPGMSLKSYLIRKIEKQLTNELKAQQSYQKKQSESVRMNMLLLERDKSVSEGLDSIKIADLTFSRNNGPMIALLKKRGTAIIE